MTLNPSNPMDIGEGREDEYDRLIASKSKDAVEEAAVAAGIVPLVPMQGHLELDATTEKRLTDLVIRRYEDAMASMTSGFGSKNGSWLSRRKLAHQHYESNFTDRQVQGSIYQHSNLSMNLPKRYSRITTAKSFDELLSAEPMFAVISEGQEDSPKDSRIIERYTLHKLTEAKLKLTLREATQAATIRGESIVKTTWKTKIARSRKVVDVLLNENGEPILTKDGNPVTRNDIWDFNEETGLSHLAKEPEIKTDPKHDKLNFERRKVTFRRVVRDGLEIKCVNFEDFVCHLAEENIHDADFIAHRFDLPIDEVAGMLGPVANTPQGRRYLNILKKSAQASEANASVASQANDNRGETGRSHLATPLVTMAECYMRCTIENDGVADEIMVLFDVDNGQVLFYDYLQNVTATGRRPFEVIRIEPVPDRWYGTGFYELFSDRHKFVDLFLNRVNFRSSITGNIRIENPFATEEGMAGEPIEFGSNKTYRLREGYDVKNVFRVITVPDDSGQSKDMLNLLLQTTQLEAGMVSGGDQGIGGLPSASLATGIKSLDRIANTIIKNIFFDLITGYESVIQSAAYTALAKHSTRDAEALMGKENAKIIDAARDTSLLGYRLKLLLSNARNSDVMESHRQAIDIVSSYYQLSPEIQKIMRPLFLQLLTSLQIDGADSLLTIPAEQAPPGAEQIRQYLELAIAEGQDPAKILEELSKQNIDAAAGGAPPAEGQMPTAAVLANLTSRIGPTGTPPINAPLEPSQTMEQRWMPPSSNASTASDAPLEEAPTAQ
jgi:hypothetical protein